MLRSFRQAGAEGCCSKLQLKWWLVSKLTFLLSSPWACKDQALHLHALLMIQICQIAKHLQHASSLVGDGRSHVVAFREALLLLFKHRVNVGDVCGDLLVGRHIGTSRVFTRFLDKKMIS